MSKPISPTISKPKNSSAVSRILFDLKDENLNLWNLTLEKYWGYECFSFEHIKKGFEIHFYIRPKRNYENFEIVFCEHTFSEQELKIILIKVKEIIERFRANFKEIVVETESEPLPDSPKSTRISKVDFGERISI